MPLFCDSYFLSTNQKNNIRVRCCKPDGEIRGIVQIAHGIAEHIERYDDFAFYLASNGFLVVGNDHLGHGKSVNDESELGFFAETGGWEMAVSDMNKLYELFSAEHPGLPYFLFGHSMGSFLTRTYIIRYQSGLRGVVLSGTGQQPSVIVKAGILLGETEIKRHGAKYKSKLMDSAAFGKYNDGIDPKRTVSDWISRDDAAVDKYIDDPLCGFMPTAGLFTDMLKGISFISKDKNIERMKKDLPILFISGSKDPVGEYGNGVIRAYESFLDTGMLDISLKLYSGGRHEMLNELNKQQVYKDVLDWLNNRI